MKIYRRGYRPPGAVTRKQCLRRMASIGAPSPKRTGITRAQVRSLGAKSQGITAKMAGMAAGRRLAKSGVMFGKAMVTIERDGVDAYANVMRGAGFAIRKTDLRRGR